MTTQSATDQLRDVYPVSREQIDRYQADGYIKLPGVLDADTIAAYAPEITEKLIELNTMHLPLAERDSYNRAFLQVGNLWQHSDLVKEFVFSPRLARIAAELMGVRAVRLYHDQALYKEADGGHTPWHRDQTYWPLSSGRTVTVWVPLQETPVEMGPLTFAAGSHASTEDRDLTIGDDSEEQLSDFVTDRGFAVDEGPFALGDVSFHAGWTVHRAGPNSLQAPRRVMTVIYMDADIRVTDPDSTPRANNWTRWLDETPVGDVAAGPLNPVLYDAG